jgi:hypothetical protein
MSYLTLGRNFDLDPNLPHTHEEENARRKWDTRIAREAVQRRSCELIGGCNPVRRSIRKGLLRLRDLRNTVPEMMTLCNRMVAEINPLYHRMAQ